MLRILIPQVILIRSNGMPLSQKEFFRRINISNIGITNRNVYTCILSISVQFCIVMKF
jgi:hypothetical protein